MRFVTLDQDSPEWLAWRRHGIGASEAAAVLSMDPWTSRAELLAAKIADEDMGRNSVAMAEGKAKEPIARKLYEELMGWQCPPCCVMHDELDWLKCSLDGLRTDGRLVLEIKCPKSKWSHEKVLRYGVPDHYQVQVQQQLLVTGLPLAHFFSYHPEFPREKAVKLRPVEADPEFQGMLLKELRAFWEEVLWGRESRAILAGAGEGIHSDWLEEQGKPRQDQPAGEAGQSAATAG